MKAILALSFLVAFTHAELITTTATGPCRTLHAVGQEQHCAWTNTYQPVAKANLYGQICGPSPYKNVSDTGLSSVCHSNEAFGYLVGSPFTQISTNVKCADAVGQYWQTYNYTWACCSCPSGWVTPNAPPLYCGANPTCVKCSNVNEKLTFFDIGPGQRLIECLTTKPATTTTKRTTTASKKPTSTPRCGSGKRDLLMGRAVACHACLDLVSFENPGLSKKGPQTVINTKFVAYTKAMVTCAKKAGASSLVDVSSSRCNKYKGPFAGKLPSAHLIGMAMDVNLEIPGHGLCNRDCFGQAYCVHNLVFNLCKPVLKTMTRRKPNPVDTIVYNFINCVKDAGLVLGPKIPILMKKKKSTDPNVYEGDWDHFQGVPTGTYPISLYEEYHPQLVSFCKGECANAERKNPSTEACPVKPSPTCS